MKEIFTMSEFEDILTEAGNKLVVVDFNATWCAPCRLIGPAFKKMAEEECFKDVLFCKVDVDEAPEVAEEYEIEMMPAFMFFKHGKKIKEVIGANKEKLMVTIQEAM